MNGTVAASIPASVDADAPESAALRRIPVGAQVSYGFGAVATGVKNAAFSAYLLLFYNQVIGIPAAIVSVAIALTLLVDAVADPVIGRWSDSTRSRWGRRHPFITGAAIPTAFFFTLTWFPPAGMTEARVFCPGCLFPRVSSGWLPQTILQPPGRYVLRRGMRMPCRVRYVPAIA